MDEVNCLNELLDLLEQEPFDTGLVSEDKTVPSLTVGLRRAKPLVISFHTGLVNI